MNIVRKRSYFYKLMTRAGRICFNCRYRIERKGNFIICKHNNRKQPIWEKANCAKWRIVTAPKRVAQINKLIEQSDGVLWVSKYRILYYKKNTSEKVRDYAPIKLGRCCFLCESRTVKKGREVCCSLKLDSVWEKAVCPSFKLTKDRSRLDQYKKYMAKSGVNTDGDRWHQRNLPKGLYKRD